MRVLHFYKTYHPDSVGGVEQVIRQMCVGTGRLGVSNTVLSLSRQDNLVPFEFEGHMVHRVPLNAEIAVALFLTEAAMLSLQNMSKRTGRSEDDLLAEIVGAQVLPGLLEPDDLAAPYLWLASDGAKDMTGQALMLDRGEVMA